MQDGGSNGPRVRQAAQEPPVGAFGDLVAALRVIASRVLRDAAPCEKDVRDALRPVARMARTNGLSAAQVVIAARSAWSAWPDDRQRPEDLPTHAQRLEELIALCVDVYFAA